MMRSAITLSLALALLGSAAALAADPPAKKPLTTAEVLAAATASDWRTRRTLFIWSCPRAG
jgi:hypothetical protein